MCRASQSLRPLHWMAACSFVAGTLFAARATADDLRPPPWRGAPLSTYAEWDFLTPSSGPPDGGLPPIVGDGGGAPLMTPTPGVVWDPVFSGSWIGDTGGTLGFYIPNWIDNEPWKDLWVQITYQPNATLPPPTLTNIQAFDPNGISGVIPISVDDFLFDPVNGLWHRTEVWRIFPNPDWETFDIFVGPDVVITQVVVDTWSVPEPGTLWLAGIGLAALVVGAWRRRR